jgi:hypothetical protein
MECYAKDPLFFSKLTQLFTYAGKRLLKAWQAFILGTFLQSFGNK